QVHRFGIAGRQDQGCALAPLRAYRTEDIGGGGPLVTRCAWAGAALRPATSGLVLLADACLVGEPDFYRVAVERLGARGFLQAHGEAFLKSLNRALRWRMGPRSGRELAVAHGAQLPAERLLGDRDAEFLEDPLRQIDQPPAHHAMDRRDRAALDHAGDGPPLKVIEL